MTLMFLKGLIRKQFIANILLLNLAKIHHALIQLSLETPNNVNNADTEPVS